MYNTKYVTTYNESTIFLDSDDINESDKSFVIDALYRKDLCNIFFIDDYDYNYDIFEKGIKYLHDKICNNQDLTSLIEIVSFHLMGQIDKEFGLMILLSFDYLYLVHPCFCEFIENGKVNVENLNKIKELITISDKKN